MARRPALIACSETVVNPYDILQVSPHADEQVIRAAYRSLIQRHHPDRHPGNIQIAELAARLTQAYELLSDPERKALLDEQLKALESLRHEPAMAQASSISKERAFKPSSRVNKAKQPTAAGITGLHIAVAFLCVGAFVSVIFFATKPKQDLPPNERLSAIRAEMESASTTEATRQKLYAEKINVLTQHPDVAAKDRELKIKNLADRSLALLTEPISVYLPSSDNSGLPPVQLVVPEITLVLGSFDSMVLIEQVGKHRQRIQAELVQSMQNQSSRLALNADSEIQIKRLIRESVVRSLDLREQGNYPSSYFESPGRYGVVEIILPKSFSLLR
jgi:curved DNA-binding protein CbpA